MKKTALTQLIEQWEKELQNPLVVLKGDKDYHVNEIKLAVRNVREIKKRIKQATELLETEREQIEKWEEMQKAQQKELLCEMMRKDEEDGLYELTKDDLEELIDESENEIKRISEQSDKKVNASVDNDNKALNENRS